MMMRIAKKSGSFFMSDLCVIMSLVSLQLGNLPCLSHSSLISLTLERSRQICLTPFR